MAASAPYSRWTILGLIAMAALIVFAPPAWWAMARPTTLNIGFVGTLTGQSGPVGTMARDGALLAIEDCNAAGGVRGASLAMLVLNDNGDLKEAANAIQRFNTSACWAIIGPTNPAVAPGVARSISANQIATISPTVSGEVPYSGDGLLSVFPPSSRTMDYAARYLSSLRRLQKPLVIVDRAMAGAPAALKPLQSSLSSLGIDPGTCIETDGLAASCPEIAQRAAGQPADSVVIIASGRDAAVFIQHLRMNGCNLPVILSECSTADDLVLYGGQAVEGVTMFTTIDRHRPSNGFRDFADRFRRRFNYAPGFAAVHGYEAARVVLLAITEASDPADVRRAMAAMHSFEGLQGRIAFGESGDTRRELFVVQVRDGVIRPME